MSEARHLSDPHGNPVTEITYLLDTPEGPVPSMARANGHLSIVEMMLWIERMRSGAKNARRTSP